MKAYKARLSKMILAMLMAGIVAQEGLGQERHQFSAAQAVDYAMKNSAQVKNALTDIKIQSESNREITASAYPQINASANVLDYVNIPTTLVPAEFFGGQPGTYQPVTFGVRYNATVGATLDQILFDGQVFVGLQARSTSIEYATRNMEVTQELIKANVYKVYYQLAAAKIQIQTIDNNIARVEKLVHDTKEIYKNGFAEQLDVDRNTVNLSNLNTQKTKVMNQVKTAYVSLKYLMGMPVKDELILTDTVTVEMLKRNLLTEDTVRYEDRKEYLAMQSLQKLNEFNIKRYKMSYIPTLSLTGVYNKVAQRNTFDLLAAHEDWFTTTYLGLTLKVPIFDGFAKDARIKQAKLALDKTKVNIEDLKNNITNQVVTARTNLESALLTLDAQNANMQLAQKVYDQTKLKYDQGLGSTTDVIQDDAALKNAQNDYYSALYDAIIAKVDYIKALGKL